MEPRTNNQTPKQMTKCGEPQLWRLARLWWLEECGCGGGNDGAQTGQRWLATVDGDRQAATAIDSERRAAVAVDGEWRVAVGDEQRRRSDCGCGGVRADRAAETAARDSVQRRRR